MLIRQKKFHINAAVLFRALRSALQAILPWRLRRVPLLLLFFCFLLTAAAAVFSLPGIGDAAAGTLFAAAALIFFSLLSGTFARSFIREYCYLRAASLRKAKKSVAAYLIPDEDSPEDISVVSSTDLNTDDIVLVKAGQQIPADGEVLKGAASVDESAITGESAPVIRECGGDRSTVTGGTTVLSDMLIIRVTSSQGESFIDRMIAAVEGDSEDSSPEDAPVFTRLLIGSAVFCAAVLALALGAVVFGADASALLPWLAALCACALPAGAVFMLPVLHTAGMNCLSNLNILPRSSGVLADSGAADVLVLEKTGAITLGNLHAFEFIPVDGTDSRELADAAQLCAISDESPEGRSIVVLAKEQFGIRGRSLRDNLLHAVPYSISTNIWGADYAEYEIRMGSPDDMEDYLQAHGSFLSLSCKDAVSQVESQGGTPLVIAKDFRTLGVIYMKDMVKKGIREKFRLLREMGLQTVMVCSDPVSAASAIAAEAGVDDFITVRGPKEKLELIRNYQGRGLRTAMVGESLRDAPALAQADVAVALNSGAAEAKSAANMIDLDSAPTKLIDVVQLGRRYLSARRNLLSYSAGLGAASAALVILSVISRIDGILPFSAVLRTPGLIFGLLLCGIFSNCGLLWYVIGSFSHPENYCEKPGRSKAFLAGAFGFILALLFAFAGCLPALLRVL